MGCRAVCVKWFGWLDSCGTDRTGPGLAIKCPLGVLVRPAITSPYILPLFLCIYLSD